MILRRFISSPTGKKARLAVGADHKTLEQFIHYASLTDLDRSSTVFKGTLYEYTVLETLKSVHFDLHRTGGADDRGIDLRGRWRTASLPRLGPGGRDDAGPELQVAIQCKDTASKIGPSVMRELSGLSVSRETLVVIASSAGFTTKSISALRSAVVPMMAILVAKASTARTDGRIEQVIWNHAAGEVLPGVQVLQVHSKDGTRLKLVRQ